jgi:nitrogen fixation-related uncharacterized protein
MAFGGAAVTLFIPVSGTVVGVRFALRWFSLESGQEDQAKRTYLG